MAAKGDKKLNNLNPETIRHKRHVEQKTLEEVSKEIGCSSMTLSRFCREHNIKTPKLPKKLTLDLSGRQFGHLKVIRPLDKRSHCSCIVWECQCKCGKLVERASNVLMHGKKTNQSCGCFVTINNFKGAGQLSATYFASIRSGAKARALPFEIDVNYAWNIFEQQSGKCALSGVDITLYRNYRTTIRKEGNHQTASLDRIDSTKGYVKGNVQWVHRRLNLMKLDTSQEEFIAWCRKIATLPRPKVIHEQSPTP